jgi:pimeloyl-ACP methyl ester carboxylesterase
MITASSFGLTVKHLLGNPNTRKDIAGFASLNYRLSTPPPLPQFAEFTEPGNEGRNVKHPAHLNDVVAGLKFLQEKYGFSENYVLVGHSCGATLAFQIPAEKGEGLKGPVGVLGVEGIYDLGKLRDDHSAVPMYQYFTESAFGIDEEAWRVASPTTQGSGFAWEKAKVVALAQSDGDELVDGEQRDVMWDFLRKNAKEGRKDELIQLVGKHDQIWREEDGKGKTQLGVSIETVLKLLI